VDTAGLHGSDRGNNLHACEIYANLTQKTWYSKTTVRSYAWSAVDGGDGSADGKVSIPVAVWMPQADVRPSGIKFGSDITRIYVLAGQAYGTPGVPDTPELMSTDVGTLYGYLVGPYNMTWSEIDPATYPNGRIINEVISWYDASVDPDKYELFVSLSPDWYKFYDGKWVGPFRGLVKDGHYVEAGEVDRRWLEPDAVERCSKAREHDRDGGHMHRSVRA